MGHDGLLSSLVTFLGARLSAHLLGSETHLSLVTCKTLDSPLRFSCATSGFQHSKKLAGVL